MSMIGRTYLERGRPVVVLIRWGVSSGPLERAKHWSWASNGKLAIVVNTGERADAALSVTLADGNLFP
jgi:hypothetical protein